MPMTECTHCFPRNPGNILIDGDWTCNGPTGKLPLYITCPWCNETLDPETYFADYDGMEWYIRFKHPGLRQYVYRCNGAPPPSILALLAVSDPRKALEA
ncbi:MAG: hypothetical protein KAJ55_00260 [Anaerolineales bacterium]|nr:hypothetical protein [Anaerolineales bacterium]